jgi:hypothetical protein
MTVRHIFEISEDDHPRTVTHARDHWWTLDFANAFVSPGVDNRGELVPSPRAYAWNGAPRRWLGDYIFAVNSRISKQITVLRFLHDALPKKYDICNC